MVQAKPRKQVQTVTADYNRQRLNPKEPHANKPNPRLLRHKRKRVRQLDRRRRVRQHAAGVLITALPRRTCPSNAETLKDRKCIKRSMLDNLFGKFAYSAFRR